MALYEQCLLKGLRTGFSINHIAGHQEFTVLCCIPAATSTSKHCHHHHGQAVNTNQRCSPITTTTTATAMTTMITAYVDTTATTNVSASNLTIAVLNTCKKGKKGRETVLWVKLLRKCNEEESVIILPLSSTPPSLLAAASLTSNYTTAWHAAMAAKIAAIQFPPSVPSTLQRLCKPFCCHQLHGCLRHHLHLHSYYLQNNYQSSRRGLHHRHHCHLSSKAGTCA
jgi:hypothetical protein